MSFDPELAKRMTSNFTFVNQTQKVCFNFQKGNCKFGEKCKFSHDIEERSKPSTSLDDYYKLQELERKKAEELKLLMAMQQDIMDDPDLKEEENDSDMEDYLSKVIDESESNNSLNLTTVPKSSNIDNLVSGDVAPTLSTEVTSPSLFELEKKNDLEEENTLLKNKLQYISQKFKSLNSYEETESLDQLSYIRFTKRIDHLLSMYGNSFFKMFDNYVNYDIKSFKHKDSIIEYIEKIKELNAKYNSYKASTELELNDWNVKYELFKSSEIQKSRDILEEYTSLKSILSNNLDELENYKYRLTNLEILYAQSEKNIHELLNNNYKATSDLEDVNKELEHKNIEFDRLFKEKEEIHSFYCDLDKNNSKILKENSKLKKEISDLRDEDAKANLNVALKIQEAKDEFEASKSIKLDEETLSNTLRTLFVKDIMPDLHRDIYNTVNLAVQNNLKVKEFQASQVSIRTKETYHNSYKDKRLPKNAKWWMTDDEIDFVVKFGMPLTYNVTIKENNQLQIVCN
jgi:hypothetical protein